MVLVIILIANEYPRLCAAFNFHVTLVSYNLNIYWVFIFKDLTCLKRTAQLHIECLYLDLCDGSSLLDSYYGLLVGTPWRWYSRVKLFLDHWIRRYMLCAQLCPTLCDPVDCSPPGSSVFGIFQARILEWVAIPFSSQEVYPTDLFHDWDY